MKDDIYRKLKQRYAAEDASILKEAAYNLSIANVVESSFWEKADQAVARIKEAQANKKPSMLSEAAKKAYSSALSNCPICKQKMNLVKLLDERQAFYCMDHKICQPLPVDGE